MSDDGLIDREEFAKLLGFNSWIPTKRYVELGIKFGLLKKDSIKIKKNTKNIDTFWYPKSWIATIKKDWATPDGGRLPKPREKAGKTTKASKTASKTSYKSNGEDKTINITIPSKEAYDVLVQAFKSKSGINDFIIKALKSVYEPMLAEAERIEQEREKELKEIDKKYEDVKEKRLERLIKKIPTAYEATSKTDEPVKF